MPAWYLILSALIGFAVLAGVAYAELSARRRREPEPALAGGFDPGLADTPVRREATADAERRERQRRARATTR